MIRMLTTLYGVRESGRGSIWHNVWKTALQVALIWGLFLWAIPEAIVRVEMFLIVPTFASTKWETLGMLLFMACSTLVLLCAFLCVWYGRGTPLPSDASTRFLAVGPYRYVRNPMVMGGLGQGVAIALILGSYGCLAYTALGAILWTLYARPLEDKDLERRFGAAYLDYRKRVWCWLPRLTPYPLTVLD